VCLIEEYCKGGSLDDVLYGNRLRPHRKPRRLPYSDLLHIATDVSAAMAYLHPSIVHRDLKPSNVLLTKVIAASHTNSVNKPTQSGHACAHKATRLSSSIPASRRLLNNPHLCPSPARPLPGDELHQLEQKSILAERRAPRHGKTLPKWTRSDSVSWVSNATERPNPLTVFQVAHTNECAQSCG
jgi:hypothetical protein